MNFASDNNAGTHGEILKAIVECNQGYAHAYGDDKWTDQAQEITKSIFGNSASVFHVFGGTPANVLAIEPMLDRFGAVLCSDEAHIFRDEAAAPERILSNKVYPIVSENGKINPSAIEETLNQFEDAHQPIPQVLSITQTSEFGTVYSLDELAAIREVANDSGLKVHIDGARFANAAGFLNCSLNDIAIASGASAISLGTTKNGGMFGENIVFLDEQLAHNFVWRRRNAMQVQSKMRFISSQYIAFFEGNLWKEIASHANSMASLLADLIKDNEHVKISKPVQTNAVFAILSHEGIEELQKYAYFYVFRPKIGEVRWMTSWQTTEQEVKEFADKINSLES